MSAPRPVESSSAAAFNRSELARQIRANFENLVRASPLPRVRKDLTGVAC